jgi:hypothetical protein
VVFAVPMLGMAPAPARPVASLEHSKPRGFY